MDAPKFKHPKMKQLVAWVREQSPIPGPGITARGRNWMAAGGGKGGGGVARTRGSIPAAQIPASGNLVYGAAIADICVEVSTGYAPTGGAAVLRNTVQRAIKANTYVQWKWGEFGERLVDVEDCPAAAEATASVVTSGTGATATAQAGAGGGVDAATAAWLAMVAASSAQPAARSTRAGASSGSGGDQLNPTGPEDP